MKKVVCLLMVLCLAVLSMAFAQAEDAKELKITFRGIDWGIPVTQIEGKMPDGIKLYNYDVVDGLSSVDNFLYDGDSEYYKGAVGYSIKARPSSLDNLKVAGYEVSGMYMYFANIPGSDGMPTNDAKNTAFIEAYYSIEPKDADAAYEDLITKLTGLYGDVVYSYEKSPYISYKYNVWQGTDGSRVCLEKEDYPSGSHYIYIKYAAGNAEELLKNAYQALVLEESAGAESNVDGL